jgi:cell fate regulator YaaT (PSP1 superfamily)
MQRIMSAGLPGAAVMLKTIGGAMVRAAVPFDPTPPFADGDAVVVNLDGSPVIGHVVARSLLLMAKQPMADDLPHVVRRASAQDLTMRRRHEQRERDAFRLGVMKIRERGLAMKLARVEQAFDGSKLVFFFTAEERVDFRELVRELASDFKTRIELRQIGVRDEARMLTGYGTCGRPLCCSTWLRTVRQRPPQDSRHNDRPARPRRRSIRSAGSTSVARTDLTGARDSAPDSAASPS